MVSGSLIQGVRWIVDAAGRIVGYRNPILDSDEALDAAALASASGAGIFGPYADTTALQAAKPAASNPGSMAYVGASAPYAQYVSNGSAWVVSGGGSGTVTATAGALTANALVLGAGTTDIKVAAGLTYDPITNTLTIASGSQTVSNPLLYSQIWNNASVDFVGKSTDITSTASGAFSLIERWRVGGSVVASISKTGSIDVQAGGYPYSNAGGGYRAGGRKLLESAGNSTALWDYGDVVNPGLVLFVGGVNIPAATVHRWSASADPLGTVDTGLARNAAGVVEVNNGTAGAYRDMRLRHVRTNATTVAGLIAAATAGAGARGFVTDANSTTFGAAAVGGGANAMPVWCDGTGWFIG